MSNEDREVPETEEIPPIEMQLDKERPIGLMGAQEIINELIRSQLTMLERQPLFKLRHFLLELRCNEFRNKQAEQSGLLPPDDGEGGNYQPAWVQ